jgi:hypothetical protein
MSMKLSLYISGGNVVKEHTFNIIQERYVSWIKRNSTTTNSNFFFCSLSCIYSIKIVNYDISSNPGYAVRYSVVRRKIYFAGLVSCLTSKQHC